MSLRSHRVPSIASGLFLGIMLAGCQADYRTMTKSVVADCGRGNYTAALNGAAAAAAQIKMDDPDRLAYVLEVGRCAQLAGETSLSDQMLGEAADIVRPYLDSKAEAKVTEAISTTAVNQTISIYRGTNPERTLVSTLLGMNALERGDSDEARRLFIAASEWQQNASAISEREIAERQADIDKKQQEAKERELEVASTDDIAKNEAFANLEALNATAAFEDPFSTYIQAVFLMSQGNQQDFGVADFSLNRVAQYHAGNKSVESFVSSEKQLLAETAGGRSARSTWVFLFDGLVAHREEVKIAIAAFPKMVQRPAALENPRVASGGSALEMVQISDVDRLVMTDFKQKLPTIIMQEILSTALKTTVTVVANEQFGAIGALAGMAYQLGSTAADLRGWHTLPKRIFVARIATPADGKIELRDGDAVRASIDVPEDFHGIVFVDLPRAEASPAVRKASLSTATIRAEPAKAEN